MDSKECWHILRLMEGIKMIVKGTKKLLTYLKIEPEGSRQQVTQEDTSKVTPDPLFFSWYANMITIERKNILILVNEKTRYTVILQGVKAADRKNIRVLIKDAVKDALENDYFNARAITEYLSAMGDVEFQKATDKSMLGKLNSSAEDLYHFGYEYMAFDRMSQGHLARILNSRIYANKEKEYFYPIDLMIKELKVFSPEEELIQVESVELKISLNLLNQEVWRTVILPINTTFDKFHKVIQTLFSWQDYHLHEFHVMSGDQIVTILLPDEEMYDAPDATERKIEKGVELAEYFPQSPKLKYIYDFGDYWEHDITLVRHLPKHHISAIYCVDGEGRTPPEDVGGPGGYEEFLEIINDPLHPLREEMLDWGRMQRYSDFDIKLVNLHLCHIHW